MTVKLKFAFQVDGVDYTSEDRELDGRQVRSRSGHNPAANYVLVQIKDRHTTSVGLEDAVDLAVEKPIYRIFESDLEYTFTVEDIGWEWGASTILEADVRAIAVIDDDRELIVDRTGHAEIVVPRGGTIDLSGKGVERVYSRKIAPPAKIEVVFVINGEPTTVKGKPGDQLVMLLEKALKESENTGQPVDAWQVTDEPGNVLDVAKTVAELGIKDGAVLLASLKAGAAG